MCTRILQSDFFSLLLHNVFIALQMVKLSLSLCKLNITSILELFMTKDQKTNHQLIKLGK